MAFAFRNDTRKEVFEKLGKSEDAAQSTILWSTVLFQYLWVPNGQPGFLLRIHLSIRIGISNI